MVSTSVTTVNLPHHLPINRTPARTSSALHGRLIDSLAAGRLHDAISTLRLMSRRGTHPDPSTYSLLLKSCIRSRRFDLGELVHVSLAASGLDPGPTALNSLLSLYSKSGRWEKAREIFEAMGDEKRNLVSWSSMVSCYANNGLDCEALSAFVAMLDRGFSPNEFCFSAAIRACSNAGDFPAGRAVFAAAIKTACFGSDICVGCALIDMFAKGFGDLDNARKVFDEMPERNAVVWTLMMTRLVQMGRSGEAAELFLDMASSGVKPDRFSLSGALSACAESGLLWLGKQLHSLAVKLGLGSDHCLGCCLVDMYAKCGSDASLDEARKVFDRMADKNVVAWTALISAYARIGGRDLRAIELFREMMISSPVQPNHFTLCSVLKTSTNLSDPGLGKQVHSLVVKLGLSSLNYVANSLITMYGQFGLVEDSRRAFDALSDKNSISYNAIIDAYSKSLEAAGEAFSLLRKSNVAGFEASPFSYSSLLSGAATLGAIGIGEQLHARAVKSGLLGSNRSQIPGPGVANALVTMYSKCGDIDAASRVFNEATPSERGVVSWTAMIAGLSRHGLSERALSTFREMFGSGSRPNEITYTAVLSACSHAGLVSEGRGLFDSMWSDHGVVPDRDHYACIVDLLGRSGRLSEALRFIRSMPFEADALIWRTFLGGCRAHGDVALGQLAAEQVLDRDPDDPAAHVLLANLHASAGEWAEAAQIRRRMKERHLVKEAGSSWLEVGNVTHKFHVGDTSHPRANEIYEELDRLVVRIKQLGYVPKTELVHHDDVEEGQKERFLWQHSEKIAVAFGLISARGPRPIRVFKNLRFCGDCHDAIKYISLATGREIVVRDSNRFHHFKTGTCSCNDYW